MDRSRKRGRPAKSGDVSRNLSARRKVRHDGYNAQRRGEQGNNLYPFRQSTDNFIENDYPENNLGLLNVKCQYCDALHFKKEEVNGHFNRCCHNGLLRLAEPGINDQLRDLFSKPRFMTNILRYNSCMAFASLSASKAHIPGVGPYCFKIQGQIYRYISDLIPSNGESPSYGQLYFIDTSDAMKIRSERTENLNLDNAFLSVLRSILSNNPYSEAYKIAAQTIKNDPTIPDLNLRFVDNIPTDKRIYNKPTADEIAGVFSSNDGEPPGYRHVVAYYRHGGCKVISVLSPHCDPMIYPLLYPYGEPGWDPKMEHNGPRKQPNRKHVTMLQFACYRLAIRTAFSHIHQSKKLFQQYIVDLYVRVEGERLHYIREHQSELRVEQYAGLQDFVLNKARLDNMNVGRIVVLPSSFEGSPRNLIQRYQDAMAIVRVYGKPDIFLTMTCNPKWSEITAALAPNETAADRPDLVSRVFHCKLDQLLRDVLKENVLGRVVAHVYVIEFQKRGLPHCHLLLILDQDSKFKTHTEIDQLISAEIPDPDRFPRLHKIVLSCMIHGPCGGKNVSSPCMDNGICSKNYPKEFSEITVENSNGYPIYRRRENGVIAKKGVHQVDNRDVVPYNPFLLLKYNAHINVEICSSIKSIKYLFKYVYKGYDSTCAQFVQTMTSVDQMDYDETVAFVNMRYISASEAMWRLHCNKMHEQSHTVVRLAVHDPEGQNVYFRPGMEEDALKAAALKHTTLTAWFELNKVDVNARQYLYSEIPQYYRFDDKKWKSRKRGGKKVIGRMYAVAPNDLNRFYLRMLLLHVKGVTSFNDIMTFNTITYKSFKEAAIARGLLEDDNEWRNCLDEMVNFRMPKQLREMFAYICCFCEPTSPLDLWTQFKDSFTEDFKEGTEEEKENKALSEINEVLKANGLSCEKCGLPIPLLEANDSYSGTDAYFDKVRGEEMFDQLNEEQKYIFTRIMDAVAGKSDENLFFIAAPGGCGKTFLYICILSVLRGQNEIALAGAFTGIAALLLTDGTTLHRLFGLPVPLTQSSVSNIKPNSEKAEILRRAILIIIDEASMIPVYAIDCIDRLLRDLMRRNAPMGGKILLFGGDFRQVLPVVPKGGKVKIMESCFQSCKLWPLFVKLRLTKNMRTNCDETKFAEWLLDLGNGVSNNKRGDNFITLPSESICEEDSIISHVFGDSLSESNIDQYVQRAIVTPKNEDCFALNTKIINSFVGNSKEYVSVDALISDDEAELLNMPLEYLNSITPSGMPPHKLILKKGAIVMMIRNMNLCSGLVNGVRMIVRGLHERCLQLEIITGRAKGNIIFMPRIKNISSDPNMPFSMSRIQFPIRLAFAMTINKSQGSTLEKIGIFLPRPVFAHGQLYVAFSRVRALSDVKVCLRHTDEQGIEDNEAYTKNIVYTELLF